MASAFWLHVLAWEPLSSQSCRTNCCSSHILPRSEEGQTEETKGGRPETPRTAAFAQPLLSQGLALSLGYVQTKGGISPKSAWGHHRHPPMTDTRCRGKGSSCWFSSEAGPPGHRAPAAEAHAAGNACAQPRTLPPPERAPPPRARPGPRRPRGSYFYDFVEAFVSHHPDIRLCVITAQQKKFHSNAQKFLKFWRISKRKKKHCHSQEEPKKT